MNRAYKFRIYPTEEQKVMLAKTFGCCRFIYNKMLEEKITEYKETGKLKRTTPAMYKNEYPFLKEVDSLALANVQLHLEKAYKAFFRDTRTGFPRFKSRHGSRASYTTNMVNGNIRIGRSRLRLPKLDEIKIRIHRELPGEGTLKSVTVSMEPSGKYYASLLYELPYCENQTVRKDVKDMDILGIDFAMDGMAVFSDGTRCGYPGYYKAAMKKLAREQRKLSHCIKGSRNYQKQKKRVACCHEKIRNQRKDFHHKLSHRIASAYDAVAVEDINMKGMSRCLHLGKGVMDNGYGMFRNMMEYKLEERGKTFVKVDRFFPSTKKCSICGKIKTEMPLSEREYICECGNQMDRDVNAAVNLREEARKILCA